MSLSQVEHVFKEYRLDAFGSYDCRLVQVAKEEADQVKDTEA